MIKPQITQRDIDQIWEVGKIRLFISHRDAHKVDVKKLSDELMKYGISGFVAHEDIAEQSSWRHEIVKALHTMDAFLCYITDDFFNSPWTNQEIGFALAKDVKVYSYRAGQVPPMGFISENQAIRTGLTGLISCLKKDFSRNSNFKNQFIENFVDARDGSFNWAKDKFYDLIDFDFNDSEIEIIVNAFSMKSKHGNQLHAVLYDKLKDEHKKHPRLKNYTYYRDYLNNDIFLQHSDSRYKLIVTENERGHEKVDISDKGIV